MQKNTEQKQDEVCEGSTVEKSNVIFPAQFQKNTRKPAIGGGESCTKPEKISRANFMHPYYQDFIGGIRTIQNAQTGITTVVAFTHRAIMQMEHEVRNGDDQRYPYEPRQIYSIPTDIGEDEEDAELTTLARAANNR